MDELTKLRKRCSGLESALTRKAAIIDKQKKEIETLEGLLDKKRIQSLRLRTMDGETERRCTTCKEWLPLSAYAKNRAKADGLAPVCRQCDKKYRYKRSIKLQKEKIENEQREKSNRKPLWEKVSGREGYQRA